MNDKAKDTEEVAVAPLRRVAIVTGASRGIGAAIAQRLALEGYSVVLNYASDGSTEAACALCAELSDFAATEAQESLALEVEQAAEPQRFIAVQADVSRFDEAKRLINEVKQQFGRIDVLVNNAGITRFQPFLEATPELFERRSVRPRDRGEPERCVQLLAPCSSAHDEAALWAHRLGLERGGGRR